MFRKNSLKSSLNNCLPIETISFSKFQLFAFFNTFYSKFCKPFGKLIVLFSGRLSFSWAEENQHRLKIRFYIEVHLEAHLAGKRLNNPLKKAVDGYYRTTMSSCAKMLNNASSAFFCIISTVVLLSCANAST